jgi:predicted permease
MVVLVAASLFTQSLARTRLINPGFSTANGLLLRLDPSLQGYAPERIAQFYHTLLDRIRSIPGVHSATRSSAIPLDGSGSSRMVSAEGESASPEEKVTAWYYAVAPAFFETLGVPLLDGREVTARDRPGTPLVAVISQTLARRLWPGEPAVGRRIIVGTRSAEVIGVVADFKVTGLREGPQPILAMSVEQQPAWESTLLIRTDGDPAALATEVRRILTVMDPSMAVIGLKTFEQGTMSALSAAQGGAAGASAFAILTLLLATAGLYGVVAYVAARRAREIAIRMALGAHRPSVHILVMRRGLRLAAAGVGAGLLLTLATGRLLAGLLYDVRPTDIRSFLIAGLVLLSVALLASWLPAWRAARLDPMRVLRTD